MNERKKEKDNERLKEIKKNMKEREWKMKIKRKKEIYTKEKRIDDEKNEIQINRENER